jgi:hypothetical protein
MAADFNGCGFGAITPDLILSSLIGCVVADGSKALRIQKYTNTATLTPVHCGNNEDFALNLSRALDMGYDDKVVLRVNIIDYFEGAGTIGECDCGIPKTVPEMLNSLFGEDIAGNVYLNVANITT